MKKLVFFFCSFIICSISFSQIDEKKDSEISKEVMKHIMNPPYVLLQSYYDLFSSPQKVKNEVEKYYASELKIFHQYQNLLSNQAAKIDLQDFSINNIKSYEIKVIAYRMITEKYIDMNIVSVPLKYKVLKNSGEIDEFEIEIQVALNKDSSKILAIGKNLDYNELSDYEPVIPQRKITTDQGEEIILYWDGSFEFINDPQFKNLSGVYKSSPFNPGTYAYYAKIDVQKDKKFAFELSVSYEGHCAGSFSGIGYFDKNGLGKFKSEKEEYSEFSLEFKFNGFVLEVVEIGKCGYHGFNCSFDNTYVKEINK